MGDGRCGSVPVKSKWRRSSSIVIATLKRTGSSVWPSSSPAPGLDDDAVRGRHRPAAVAYHLPLVEGAAGHAVGAPRPAQAPAVVVVRAGDTLWAIAARALPAGATDAEIARAGARWHAANRDVIGADPNLILPVQRLVPPLGKDPT